MLGGIMSKVQEMASDREQEVKKSLSVVRTLLGNRVMPDSQSTTDQLKDLYWVANQLGLYDAADAVKNILEKK